MSKIFRSVLWWLLAGIVWLLILPVSASLAVALVLSAILTPLAGIANLFVHLAGWQSSFFVLGTVALSPWVALPVSFFVAAVLFFLGWFFWKVTTVIFHWLMHLKPRRSA